jgi:hypothetical protein
MKTDLDIRVVELLCSRLCHELVSPVGAINNGVELMEEMGAEMADEAMPDRPQRRSGIAPPAPAAAGLWGGW